MAKQYTNTREPGEFGDGATVERMSDAELVEKLRSVNIATAPYACPDAVDWCHEAADRLEALSALQTKQAGDVHTAHTPSDPTPQPASADQLEVVEPLDLYSEARLVAGNLLGFEPGESDSWAEQEQFGDYIDIVEEGFRHILADATRIITEQAERIAGLEAEIEQRKQDAVDVLAMYNGEVESAAELDARLIRLSDADRQLLRMIAPFVNERSREPGDAWNEAAAILWLLVDTSDPVAGFRAQRDTIARAEAAEADRDRMKEALRAILDEETISVHVGYDNGVGGGNFIYADAVRTDSAAFANARASLNGDPQK